MRTRGQNAGLVDTLRLVRCADYYDLTIRVGLSAHEPRVVEPKGEPNEHAEPVMTLGAGPLPESFGLTRHSTRSLPSSSQRSREWSVDRWEVESRLGCGTQADHGSTR